MSHRFVVPGRARKRAWLGLVLISLLAAACAANGPARKTSPTSNANPLTPQAGTATPASGTTILMPEAGGQAGSPVLLSSLRMMTPTAGWATGWTNSSQRQGGILRTADGGYQWQNASPPGIDPDSIETTFFLDAMRGWVVSAARGATAAGSTPVTITFLRTADGGQTWQRSTPLQLTSSGPGWLDFVDPQHGWYMADLSDSAGSMAVAVYRTTDGGQTWESVSVTAGDPSRSTAGSMPLACNKTGISFINPTTGWATGHCTTGGVFFYVTHDGGFSWRNQTLQPPADSPAKLFEDCDCETVAPVFASGQNGVTPVKIFISEHEAVLYYTGDGGTTWRAGQLASKGLLRPPDFVSATEGWVTDESRVFVTHDGGQTWTAAGGLPPSMRLLGTMDFVDLKNGWVTGGQQLYRTTDAAQTWQPITPMLAPK